MEVYRSELLPQFVELFVQKMGFTEEEFTLFLSHFRREYLPRKYFLLKAGQVTNQKTYINKGSARSYTLDERGREHILHFSFEDWWLGDIESYYTGQPGKQYIQATEDCELLCISKADFEGLKTAIPKLQQWEAIKQQKNLFANMNRLNEVKSMTVEERYQSLLQKHPHIFQRIPLQYIAGYLDIEPPSLSRLRKRLSTGK